MYNLSTIRKKLEFIIDSDASAFVFVVANSNRILNDVYDSVMSKVAAKWMSIRNSDNILETVRNYKERNIFITIESDYENTLLKLNYLRDSLNQLDKYLIFGLLTYQYELVFHKYPDFNSYSIATLECTDKWDTPFQLLCSNDIVFSSDKKYYSSNSKIFRNERFDEYEYLKPSDLDFFINKFKYVKLRQVELSHLNEYIITIVDMLDEPKEYFYSKDVIMRLALDYAEVLCAKEKWDYLEELLNVLCRKLSNIYFYGQPFDDSELYILEVCRKFINHIDMDYGKLKFLSNHVLIRSLYRILECSFCYFKNHNMLREAAIANCWAMRLVHKQQFFFSDQDIFTTNNDNIVTHALFAGKTFDGMVNIYRAFVVDYINIKDSVSIKNSFLMYYNSSLLNLNGNNIAEAKKLCYEFFDICEEYSYQDSVLYYRILILRNWIIGVHDGRLEEALESNLKVLERQREIFLENHYSIAETHYCNAVFYYNMMQLDNAMHCLQKAKNVINQNSGSHHKLLEDQICLLSDQIHT